MKRIVHARLIVVGFALLVLLSVGFSSSSTLVHSATPVSPVIDADAVWDVATTYDTSEQPVYSSDNTYATYNLDSAAGTLYPVYFDTTQVPQDIQDYANQTIYDINNGALTGVVTVDLTVSTDQYYTYAPAEFSGEYDSELQQQYQYEQALNSDDSSLASREHGPSALADPSSKSIVLKSGIKASFKVSGSFEKGKTPGQSSMVFGGEDVDASGSNFNVNSSKFMAPSLGFGGADFKVKDWGNSPKDSIKQTMKKHNLQVDIESVQVDAASNTVSVRQRVSLKRRSTS